jgi:hypothetical protein
MNKEKCVLVITENNPSSYDIIDNLIKANYKIRILTDDLKSFKMNYFKIWEKFESVNQIDQDNIERRMFHMFDNRRFLTPSHVFYIKTVLNHTNKGLYIIENKLVKLIKEKEIKKLCLFEINNSTRLSLAGLSTNILEKHVRQSGLNYLIIRDFKAENQSNLVNFLNKIIEGQIFAKNSTFKFTDDGSIDILNKNYILPFTTQFFNFYYRDKHYFNKTPDIIDIQSPNTVLFSKNYITYFFQLGLVSKFVSLLFRAL